jgi:hypothetical protein
VEYYVGLVQEEYAEDFILFIYIEVVEAQESGICTISVNVSDWVYIGIEFRL